MVVCKIARNTPACKCSTLGCNIDYIYYFFFISVFYNTVIPFRFETNIFVIIKARHRLCNEYYKFQLMSEYFNTSSKILFESFI